MSIGKNILKEIQQATNSNVLQNNAFKSTPLSTNKSVEEPYIVHSKEGPGIVLRNTNLGQDDEKLW